MRTCNKCFINKEEDCFGKNAATSSGRHLTCKNCVNATSREATRANPEKIKETLRRHVSKSRLENPQLYLWKKARDRVKYEYAGREFTITPEDICIPEYCPLLNIKLNSGDKDAWASVDRIDSNIGYIPGNIQVISLLANQMKNRATKEQLLAFAKGILEVYSKEVSHAPTAS